MATLKSLIEEHSRLDFSDFLSTLLTIFHVINEKFHPARVFIYLVNKPAGGIFSNPARLFWAARILWTSSQINRLKSNFDIKVLKTKYPVQQDWRKSKLFRRMMRCSVFSTRERFGSISFSLSPWAPKSILVLPSYVIAQVMR